MIRKTALLAGALLLLAAAPLLAAQPDGVWLSASGKTKIKIAPCGGNYCGTITWVKGPETKDVNNPDASKHGQNLVGMQMIYGMAADGDGYKGNLYDYTSGKTYTGKMTTDGGAELSLSGCVLGGLICRSEKWSRSN